MTSIFLHGPGLGPHRAIAPRHHRQAGCTRLAPRRRRAASIRDHILGTTRSRWAVPLCVQLPVMPKDPLLVEWEPPLRDEIGRDARTLGDAVVHADDSREFLLQALHRSWECVAKALMIWNSD